jgi:precorrin-2 dehydrogenase/sirohydrochlorin ferrochelatase
VLPIVLNPAQLAVGLAGAGEGRERRRALLEGAGIAPVPVDADAGDEALQGLAVLFVAGVPDPEARAFAARARRSGVLVNVEDVPALCDFHVPAVVRRGDLLVTVSTGGKAPGLARLIREWLERRLGADWRAHMDETARARTAWRADGHSPQDVSRRTRALVSERGWLP